MGDVDTESVHAFAAPESKNAEEFLMYLGIVPVEVGLLLGEGVQVIPAITAGLPGGPAEIAQPVGRRQLPMLAFAAVKYVAGAFRGAGSRSQRRTEPFMLVRGVVRYDVDDDLDAKFARPRDQLVELFHRAETRIDRTVIGHIIPAVRQRRRIERR